MDRVLRSELVLRLEEISLGGPCVSESRDPIAMDSLDRGDPLLLCEDVDEYGESGSSCEDIECPVNVEGRDRGGGERDARRRFLTGGDAGIESRS